MTKIFALDKGQTAADLIEEIAGESQPLYLYYYEDINRSWLIISQVEIPDEDLDGVAYDLIEEYEEDNDDDYDYTADDRNYDIANGR